MRKLARWEKRERERERERERKERKKKFGNKLCVKVQGR